MKIPDYLLFEYFFDDPRLPLVELEQPYLPLHPPEPTKHQEEKKKSQKRVIILDI
jgi:hypothetical protein